MGLTPSFPDPSFGIPWGLSRIPSAIFNCHWYVKKSGDAGYAKVADGYSPRIPFSNGMMLKLEVEDRGPYVALTQGGKVLTQGGKAVVVRKFGKH